MPRQQQQQPPQPGYLPMPQQPCYPPQPGYPLQQPGGYMGQMMPHRQPIQAPMPSQLPTPGQPPIPGRPGYNQLPAPGRYWYISTAQRRLDPDQMPNPISIIIENQNSAAFITNEEGLLPPLVTTKYVVKDQGNSSPRYVRSSLYCIPATADLLKNNSFVHYTYRLTNGTHG
ncbi:protein transport protein Sec24D-like [Eurosta solidaginis]|uniref:protein transport protein Sec24D-like n=1 Tax=Eurosta solidaginis TaxID=178769 RepID=UPI0035314E3B